MQIIIRTVPSDIFIQTVTVTQNKKTPDNTYLFHCYQCGTGIAQIKGNVTALSAGLIPTGDVVVFYKCYRCPSVYTFQTARATNKRIKLTLSPHLGQVVSEFHCVICRTECLKYDLNSKTPLDFDCINYTCAKKYVLNDVVSLTD